MKTKVITGVALALATVLASPAFAQTTLVNQPIYAQSELGPHWVATQHSPRRSWDVYNTNGRYVGSDPDPNVRQMIARDHVQQLNGGY
jgi:hypothetical protein